MVAPLLAVASVAVAPTPAEAIVQPQTRKTISLEGTLSTSDQSLWDPAGGEPASTEKHTLFDQSWQGSAGFDEFEGDEPFKFGVGGAASSSGRVGMSVKLEGVRGGRVGVTYPVKVDVTVPDDKTFGATDEIEIATSPAVVQPGAEIDTQAPALDRIGLNGVFKANAHAGFEVCFFVCGGEGGSLFDIPEASGEIVGFDVSDPAGIHCFGSSEKTILGLAATSADNRCPAKTGYVARPSHAVTTTTNPDGSLTASGMDTYAVLPVSAGTWLKRLSGDRLELQGSKGLGDLRLTWTVLGLTLLTEVSRREELTFTPEVSVTLDLPWAAPYRVVTPGGAQVASGTGSAVTLTAGNKVFVTLPAHQTTGFTVTPTLSLSQHRISNEVTDRIQTSGFLTALAGAVKLPSATGFSGLDANVGPAYTKLFNVAGGTRTVVPKSSWTLGGFSTQVLSPLPLLPAPPPEVTPKTFAAVEGASMTAPVATFTDEVTKAKPEDYVATITWGDDTSPTVGTITKTDGVFTIAGTHVYEQYRSYPISVDLQTVPTGQLATNHVVTSTKAVVADAALTGTGVTNNTTATGQPVLTWSNPSPAAPNNVVATFKDANPFGLLSDLSATIDWGDGTPVTQGVVSGPTPSSPVGGPVTFTIAGAHDYKKLGLNTVTVTLTSKGGSSAVAKTITLSYTNPARGTFLLGGKKATGAVTYWGAQWMKANALTYSTSSSFKGFANQTAPSCGATWVAAPAPGNSVIPPASVPTYMAVGVTNGVVVSGAKASGTIDKVVVVATKSGYGPDPSATGTGTVVAVLCEKR